MKYPISQLDFERDFASFVDLSRAIYGDKAVTDEAMFRWLFEKNIYNPRGSHFFHVAKDGDRVVASDCLMPVPIQIEGKHYLAAWSIKTMTHPDYQRQGIFRAMTEHNIARARELGIDVILGFANSNSYPGYKKFGWDVLVERRAVIRPLDIKGSLAKRKGLAPLAGMGNALYKSLDRRRLAALAAKVGDYHTEICTDAPLTSEEMWSRMRAAVPVLVQRDPRYIDWRYNQRPGHDYKFALARDRDKEEAMLVFRHNHTNDSCIIIDYVGAPHSTALPSLLVTTIRHCLAHNLRYIICSSGRLFDDYLNDHFGFKYLTSPLANNMFIACRLNEAIALDTLKTESNWFYSYGDSELDIDLAPRR
jgi:GNAT superfamily N-acetyltransferase